MGFRTARSNFLGGNNLPFLVVTHHPESSPCVNSFHLALRCFTPLRFASLCVASLRAVPFLGCIALLRVASLLLRVVVLRFASFPFRYDASHRFALRRVDSLRFASLRFASLDVVSCCFASPRVTLLSFASLRSILRSDVSLCVVLLRVASPRIASRCFALRHFASFGTLKSVGGL